MREKMSGDGKITLSWEKDGDGFRAELSGNSVDVLEVLTMNYAAFVVNQLASGALKAEAVSQVFAQLLAKFGTAIIQLHPELMKKPEVLEALPFLATIADALHQGPAGVRADVEKIIGKELADALTAAVDRQSSPDAPRSPVVDRQSSPDAPRSPVVDTRSPVDDTRSPVDARTAKEKERDAKLAEINKTMRGGSDGQR